MTGRPAGDVHDRLPVDRTTSGTFRLRGEETTLPGHRALTRLRGHDIGFVFQYHHLITAFTARENVMMPMLGAEEFPSRTIRARAEALLAAVGLDARRDRGAGTLSGERQHRVSVARALAMEPALLLADEPTGNLGTRSADEVFALLRRSNGEQGPTVLFVTHNATMAPRRDRTIEVIDGRVTA